MNNNTDWLDFDSWRDVSLVAGGIGLAMLGLTRRSPLTLIAGGIGAFVAAKTANEYIARGEAGTNIANNLISMNREEECARCATVAAPMAQVFGLVSDLAMLPQFMPVIKLVNTVDEKRSLWTVKAGPTSFLVDVEKTVGVDDDYITLSFSREGTAIGDCTIWLLATGTDLRETRVTMRVKYHPLFMRIGNALIRPILTAELDTYLYRLKQFVETGEIARNK